MKTLFVVVVVYLCHLFRHNSHHSLHVAPSSTLTSGLHPTTLPPNSWPRMPKALANINQQLQLK